MKEWMLKAMREQPDEHTLLLAYADMLDEDGDADRAELIRLGCAIEAQTRDGKDPPTGTVFRHHTLMSKLPRVDVDPPFWVVRYLPGQLIHSVGVTKFEYAWTPAGPTAALRKFVAEHLTLSTVLPCDKSAISFHDGCFWDFQGDDVTAKHCLPDNLAPLLTGHQRKLRLFQYPTSFAALSDLGGALVRGARS